LSQSEATAGSYVAVGRSNRAKSIERRARKLERPPAWRITDLITALSLALVLLPAWLLPERLWSPFWRGIARVPLLTNRRAIRENANNIQTALAEPDRRRAEAIARNQKAAVNELRMEDLRAWRPGGWNPAIAFEGEEHLKRALDGGKGAILWVAPFVFNSAQTKIALHRNGYRVSHLSSPQHGFSRSRWGVATLNRIRCAPEDKYLAQRIIFDQAAPAAGMRRMMRALNANEVVTIVAVSTLGSGLIKGPIFGGELSVAVGAPRLAGLTGAPLLPVFTVRDPKLGFRVVIEAPIPIDPARAAEERCLKAASEFHQRSEPWVRQYPEQWRAWSKWLPL
jgi:lauroyl/myristoyl acyltransferase